MIPYKAMVLAAGLGTRLKPVTDTLPKALVQVDNRALIDHALDLGDLLASARLSSTPTTWPNNCRPI